MAHVLGIELRSPARPVGGVAAHGRAYARESGWFDVAAANGRNPHPQHRDLRPRTGFDTAAAHVMARALVATSVVAVALVFAATGGGRCRKR